MSSSATQAPAEDGVKPVEPARSNDFTARETKFLLAYVSHMTSRPTVNWDALAAELGLKDGKSAASYSRVIFIKHGIGSGSEASGSVPGTPRKRKTASMDSPADGARVVKARTPRKKKAKTEAEDEVKEETKEDTESKIKGE